MTKAFGPKRSPSFRDKYLALALIAAAFFFTESVQAQNNDINKYTWYRYLYGNRTARMQADTVLAAPQDTIWSKVGFAIKGGVAYSGNGSYWTRIGTATVSGATVDTIQVHTSGSTVTVSNSTSILYIDPGATIASLTITLPAVPHSSNRLTILFGGTITSGNTVVTSLTISPNSGQAILQATTPSRVESGDPISYQYRSSNLKWYRK